jgi:hypothetical protein
MPERTGSAIPLKAWNRFRRRRFKTMGAGGSVFARGRMSLFWVFSVGRGGLEVGFPRRASVPAALSVCALIVLAGPAGAQDLESAVQESYATNLVVLRDATRAAVAELFMGFTASEGTTLLVEPAGDHQANWFVESHILSHLTRLGYQAYLKPTSLIGPPAPSPPRRRGARRDSVTAAERDTLVAPEPEGEEAAEEPGAEQGAETMAGGDEAGESGAEQGAKESALSAGSAAEEDASLTRPERDRVAEPGPDFVLRYRVVHFELSYPKNYRTSPLGSRKVQRRFSVSLQAHLLRGEREDVVWVNSGDVEGLDVVPASKLSLIEGTDFPFTKPELRTRGLGSLVEPALVSGIVAGLIYLFYTNQD